MAARLAVQDLPAVLALATLRDHMEERLLRTAPEAVVLASGAGRLPNTTCIALPSLPAETQVMALDLAGVAVSAGSACSSGKVRPSHVLRAMGADPALVGGAIRISLGWRTDEQDIDHLLDAWTTLVARARSHQYPDRAAMPVSAA